MFDKVDMTTFVNIEGAVFEKLLKDESNSIKRFTYIDNESGEIRNIYTIHDKKLKYIKYNDSSKRLFISLSIPKLLYGNNIKEIDELDIKEFFNIIHKRLNELFNLYISDEEWKINEVEVSKNFILDSNKQVTEYIEKLSKIRLPRKATIKYNNESVYYKNKSQTIKFYDKYHELLKQKDIEPELLRGAKNILRFEVQATGYLLKEFSDQRKAVDLLTKEYFVLITSKIIDLINSKITLGEKSIITPIIFDSGLKTAQIESSIAIAIFTDKWGESTLKDIYPSSTLNRKQVHLRDLTQYVQERQGIEQKLFLKL